jgi:hypothetical protein
LPPPRGDQALRAGADDRIEVSVNLVEKPRRETVFVGAEVKDGDLVLVGQANSHGLSDSR